MRHYWPLLCIHATVESAVKPKAAPETANDGLYDTKGPVEEKGDHDDQPFGLRSPRWCGHHHRLDALEGSTARIGLLPALGALEMPTTGR